MSNFTFEQMTLKNSDMASGGSGEDTRREEEFGFKSVMENALGAFSLQRGILPTMRDLLLRPNQVVDAYFRGEKRYLGPGRWLSFCLTVMGLCSWLGGKWVIQSAWKEEDFERLVKDTGSRAFVEQWEANQIAITEALLGNPSLLLAACFLPFVFSFKWMFRKSGRNWAQHFMIQMYYLGLVLVLTSLPNLIWMGQEFHIENLAESALKGFPEIPPRGSYLVYTCFYWLFLSGYYVWASRSIFGGKTFPVIVRTLGALALAGVLFNLASWLTILLVM